MSRRATGTIEWVPATSRTPGHWKARIRFADGTRPWIQFPPEYSESEARLRAESLAGTARAEEWVSTPQGAPVQPAMNGQRLTWSQWFPKWFAFKRARGMTSVHDNEGHWKNHLEPLVGSLYCDATTPRDLRHVVDVLNDKVSKGYTTTRGKRAQMSAKTAQNIWSTLTAALSDAVSGHASIRVLEDRANPAADVRGPEDGADREKHALYPDEFLKALRCERWSIEMRRMLAVSIYLYVRAGELDALEWRDVEIERRLVNVRRAMQANGEIGPPKNGKARTIPIEPTLVPLLEAMRAEAIEGAGGEVARIANVRVFGAVPKAGKLAKYLRELLTDAGVTRDIFTTDATTKALGWHDATRATGITWRVARGDRHAEVRDDAGHQSVTTTEGYDRSAKLMRHAMVEVFPELPPCLLSRPIGPDWSGNRGGGSGKSATSKGNQRWRRRESPPDGRSGAQSVQADDRA